MEAQGLRNYAMEWWHYTLRPEPTPDTLYDVPVAAPDGTSWQAEIQRLVQPYDGDVPGVSLVVVKDGKPLLSRGYGRSDMERGPAAGHATDGSAEGSVRKARDSSCSTRWRRNPLNN